MGDSSLKKIFFRKKKKKSPFSDAFKELQRALPKKKKKKSKKKSLLKQLHLESLKKDKKSKKKVAWIPPTRDKKAPKSTKILSLGKERKESNTSEGQKEDREGLARVGDKIKKTFSPENKKEVSAEPEVAPLKETHEGKISLQKLKDIVKPRRQSETNAN